MAEIAFPNGLVTLVDDEDLPQLLLWSWWVSNRYVRGYRIGDRKQRRQTFLHRIVMGAVPGMLIDHINGDTLDNRKTNLRPATSYQNQGNRVLNKNNTSGYKGVSKRRAKWCAQIFEFGVYRHIGSFDTPEEAARAYDAAAILHFGEFAWLNFPLNQAG